MRKHTTHFNDCGCLREKWLKQVQPLIEALGYTHPKGTPAEAERLTALSKWDALQKGGGKK